MESKIWAEKSIDICAVILRGVTAFLFLSFHLLDIFRTLGDQQPFQHD